MSPPNANSAPPPLVAVVAWLLPGGGYFLIGQRSRALAVGISILALFVMGLFIGGMRVVEPASGYFDAPMNAIMQRPWFVGQILTGPITLVAAMIGRGPEFVTSHARLNEIGTLYTAIAGMLNLLAIIDSTYRAAHEGDNA